MVIFFNQYEDVHSEIKLSCQCTHNLDRLISIQGNRFEVKKPLLADT